MYSLAIEMRIIKKSLILRHIVQDLFNVLCQSYLEEDSQADDTQSSKALMKDTVHFATVGLELSVMLYGQTHSVTEAWRSRTQDPIECFKNYNDLI